LPDECRSPTIQWKVPAGARCRVIKLETAHIEEVRGIRDRDIALHGKAGK
jgi:hypothetical protein